MAESHVDLTAGFLDASNDLGFLANVKLILVQFLINVVRTVLQGLWIVVMFWLLIGWLIAF